MQQHRAGDVTMNRRRRHEREPKSRFVSDRRADDLQIRTIQVRLRTEERSAIDAIVLERTAIEEPPAQHIQRGAVVAEMVGEGLLVVGFVDRVHHGVLVQVLPNAGQIDLHLDPHLIEMRRRTNAGEHQQLW